MQFSERFGTSDRKGFVSSIWESFTAVRQASFLEPQVRSDEILRHEGDSWRTGLD